MEGANLSTGDMHFSQGDGEVSFCGAIEMSGFLELKYISHILISLNFSKFVLELHWGNIRDAWKALKKQSYDSK